MKKIVSFISLLALLVSGCSQEEMLHHGTSVSGGRVFTASFENNESRTYLEDGRLSRWTEGDRISLFDASTLNSEYKFDGKTGDKGGAFSMLYKPEGTGIRLTTNYAVYPYDKDMMISSNGVITLDLPSTQHYAENTYGLGDNTMVAVTEDVDDTFLKFKNVGGCLKLQLYGKDIAVQSIVLIGNNNEKIAGSATITAASCKTPVVKMADDATTYITLDCGEKGVKIGRSAEEATAFWMVVPPTTFDKGFTVIVTDMNDEIYVHNTNNKIVVERNVIKSMTAIEPQMSYDSIIPEELKDSCLTATVQVDGANVVDFYKDCYISSIYDKVPVSDGTMQLQSKINQKVQTYFLTDDNDHIYMMARVSDAEKNKNIVFNAENTTMAFVTFHPFFANIDSQAYDVLKEAILQSKNFQKLRIEINNVIRQKQDLYNQGNSALFGALDDLLDEIIVFTANPNASRAITNETQFYPFKINSKGKRVDFQVFGLNPTYYGTATHANGDVKSLVVESHEDFGLLSGLETVANILMKNGWEASQYGEIESYTFPDEGECHFQFSCKGILNNIDLAMRIFDSCMDMLGGGLSYKYSDELDDIYKKAVAKGGEPLPYFPFFTYPDVNNPDGYPLEIATDILQKMIDIAYDNEIETFRNLKNSTKDRDLFIAYSKRVRSLMAAKARYNRVTLGYTLSKGIINIIARYATARKAIEDVDFTLCCYNNEIQYCSHIRKYTGDNQSGYYEAELSEPIGVMVNVNTGNLTDYVVKFEVVKGGGSVGDSKKKVEYIELGKFDYTVCTKWTMGSESAEQIVKASLCDKETMEEVSESVEFKATAQPPLLSIDIDEEYDELPYYKEGIVTFNPTIHVTTPETDKIDKLYDWGIILYEQGAGEELKEIKRMSIGTDSYEFDFTHEFTLAKSEMKLDYTTYIAKNDEKYYVCAYVVYKKGGKPVESEVINSIKLVYDQKPSFTLSNLSYQTVPYNDGVYHYMTTYLFDIHTTGALWMDNFYRVSYMFGKDVFPVEPRDAVAHAYYSFLFSYSTNTLESIDYIGATVNGTEVKSKNFIYMFTYKSQCDMVLMNWANMPTLPVKMESRSADAFTTFEDAGMSIHFSEIDK